MVRRGNGDGTISRRADGRWMARWTDAQGKRHSLYATSDGEARRLLRQKLRERDQGLPVSDERQTLAQWLTSWLETREYRVRRSSWERDARDIRLHIVPILGNERLARLTPQQIGHFYAVKLREGCAPSSVFRMHSLLHSALEAALRLGLVARNITDLVDAPQPVKRPFTVWTHEEAQRFLSLARAEGDALEPLYQLALATAMRQGELLALRWRDVDLDARTLRVVATLNWLPGATWALGDPKTEAGRRTIELGAAALDALRRQRAHQAKERLAAGARWHDDGFVFTTKTGKPLRPQTILNRSFRPLGKRAGVPRIRFHDLRHTAATLLLRAAIHPKVVSELLGHSSIAITLGVYSHVLPTMQRDATAALDVALGYVTGMA